MWVTPGNVSFVNCGKSSIVISPYFFFICSGRPAAVGWRTLNDRRGITPPPPAAGAGAWVAPACAPGAGGAAPAPPGAAPRPPPPPRPAPPRVLKIDRIGHVHDARRSSRSLSVLNCASARSAGVSATPAAVSPAPATRMKFRRSIPLSVCCSSISLPSSVHHISGLGARQGRAVSRGNESLGSANVASEYHRPLPSPPAPSSQPRVWYSDSHDQWRTESAAAADRRHRCPCAGDSDTGVDHGDARFRQGHQRSDLFARPAAAGRDSTAS